MSASPLTHLYLSPHLDDAVLSCGGMIHRQVRAGDRVVVLTLCAGDPSPGPLSGFAQSLHERWRTSAEAVAARRAENLAALDVLGAEGIHLPIPDCIYRADPLSGRHLYASQEALFGDLPPAEFVLAEQAAQEISRWSRRFPQRRRYVPLGLGHHVDHQLARRAAELAGDVYAYFEDYPYAAQEADSARPAGPHPKPAEGAGASATSPPPPPATPGAAIYMAPGGALSAELVPLSEADLSAKIRAIAAYVSQISTFWEDVAVMGAAVRLFAERTGGGYPAERLWRVV